MTEQFKWVDYYEEFASKLLEYRKKYITEQKNAGYNCNDKTSFIQWL